MTREPKRLAMPARSRVTVAIASVYRDNGAALVHGWRFDRPGPARFGWWLCYASGACTWLGATAAKVERAIAARIAYDEAVRAEASNASKVAQARSEELFALLLAAEGRS